MRAIGVFGAAFVVVLAIPVASADHPWLAEESSLFGQNVVYHLLDVEYAFARWEAKWPQFVDHSTIGQSAAGLPLLSVRVTDESVPYDAAPLATKTKLRVYLDGSHHGNEPLGSDLVMYYVEGLLKAADQKDPAVLDFFAKHEMYATPLVNADGNHEDTRKNLRQVDLNRNYDFHWGEEGASDRPLDFTYHGPSVLSEPESQATTAFLKAYMPDVYVTMHTGIAEFYWPWGWTHDKSPDDALWLRLEKPFEEATNGKIDAKQGAELYIVAGASDDYAYGVLGIRGFTFEVDRSQFVPVFPEPIPERVQDQLNGLDFVVKNTQWIGAWLEARATPQGLVVENVGWGDANDVRVQAGDHEVSLARLAAGSSVTLPSFTALETGNPTATIQYRILLLETSPLRTLTAELGSAADLVPDEIGQLPSWEAGVVLALVGFAALRFRRRD